MANINEILARAESLRKETALNSIDPERAGGIMYDTLLALNELWLQQGAALVISKIYASVAAMEADTAPVSDLTGKPLRPGQIVVIASSDSDNGSVYRYNGTDSPRWSLVGSIGNLEPVDNLESDSTALPLAAHQGKVLDGKISQLGQEMATLKTIDEYPQYLGSIANEGIIELYDAAKYIVIPVNPGISFFIKGGTVTKFAFVKSFTFNPTLPYTLDLCTGQSVVILSNGQEYSGTIPQDAKYLLLTAVGSYGTSILPANLSIGGWDYVNKDYASLQRDIVEIGNDTQDLIDTIYDIFTSEPGGAYSDSGVKISTSQELGFTPLIPIQKGQILKYSGQVSEYIHGLLIYSDGSTVVDTAFIGGTFDRENYIVTNPNARFVRCQGRNQNFSPELFNPFVEIYTPASSVQENLEKTINERTTEELEIATSQVPYVYGDDGSRLASQNYNGTTDGLIPVSVGDIIVFTGILSAARHGLLFYSDEDTIVATSLIDGTFTNEKVVVENPSIRYFRAQALNANYDPSVTTQLSISLFKDIKSEVKELNERVTTIEESLSVTPDIIIEKVADGAFDVKVKQESNGKYLTHRFLRHRYSRLVRYGTTGEATHEEICSDCWYPSQIYDGTTDILQGNANFINYVANKENEQSYAGEGHGATISDYVHFFADGVEFDPNTLTGRLECGTFRMVEKNVIYAIDTTQPNFNSDNAIPKFDESGNKEISTIHWLDGVWEKNNTIKYRHRLTIKRDDTQFRYCFGAMLEMEQDNFPHIIINDADGTENLVSYENNQWTCTPINGSSVVLQSDITNKGDEIVGFGTKYIVRQRMLQALTERAKISSMFPRLYTGNSYRVKFYQQPIVTTANYAAVGLPAETFDDGDVVELFVERNIEFTE